MKRVRQTIHGETTEIPVAVQDWLTVVLSLGLLCGAALGVLGVAYWVVTHQ